MKKPVLERLDRAEAEDALGAAGLLPDLLTLLRVLPAVLSFSAASRPASRMPARRWLAISSCFICSRTFPLTSTPPFSCSIPSFRSNLLFPEIRGGELRTGSKISPAAKFLVKAEPPTLNSTSPWHIGGTSHSLPPIDGRII